MKKAFKTWYVYLIAFGLLIIVSLVALIPYFAINDSSIWPKQYISYVYLFSGVVLFGVGFIIQDLYRGRIRQKTKNWNNPLEEKYLVVAWKIFSPAFLSGITSILSGLISYIFLR